MAAARLTLAMKYLAMTVATVILFCVVQVRGDTNLRPGLPEQHRCDASNDTCSLVVLTCPPECPQRGTVGDRSACQVDCDSCKVSCRNRVADCIGFGSVCYDPRFIGGDGVMFYFHGQKDQDFCLISDRNLHINAHFIGKRPHGRPRDFTWVQALGILFKSHELSVEAKKVGAWDDTEDQFYFSIDGQDFTVPSHEGALWISPDGQVAMERTTPTNSVRMIIKDLMEALVTVVPITPKESRRHRYQITADDCFAHLNLQFSFFGLSTAVDGILGQTYQLGFKNPEDVEAPMPSLGGDVNYNTSSLLSADCAVSQFLQSSVDHDRELNNHVNDHVPSRRAILCDSSTRGGITCRR